MALSLLTWNLGYAGLGAEAEFVADAGPGFRVESREGPGRWTKAIAGFAGSRREDLLLFQEAAKPSWVNHGCDLLGALETSLRDRTNSYAYEFNIPLPFGMGSKTA